ncbi:NAD-dependent epimerase/dehydratase family protein [Candidatus Roizmanbacteria bacterium]|nr:NAD-dependent epimerase/dehydratase family protein [Candidatus Roizmanbacteria bacterium]
MKKKKILVCGASGFIGRNIVERLSKRDDLEVYGTYFESKPNIKGISLIRVDLTNKSEVNKIIKGKDIVIQAAAVTSGSRDIVTKPYLHVTDNAIMNSLIFKSCFSHKVQHVVFFSCTVMYPNKKSPVKEEDFNYEITDKYFGVGWTKVYLEKMCEFYSKLGYTKYTAIRHSNMYGPFDKYDLDKSHFFGATITKVLRTRDNKIVVWGDGSEERDLLYVSDLVNFIEIVLKKQKEPFELINVGRGEAFSVKDVINKIIAVSGKKIQLEFDTSKPTIKFNLAVNTDRVRKKYNWKPKTSLEEGIKKTIDWYKENVL